MIREEDVLPGVAVPIEPDVPYSPVAPVSTGTAVMVDLPGFPGYIDLRFRDGGTTDLGVPVRHTRSSAALSTFMHALTPVVALCEVALFPILFPVYLFLEWAGAKSMMR